MKFCEICNVKVSNLSAHKKSNIHKANNLLQTEFHNVQIIATAFKNRIISYRINSDLLNVSPENFLFEVSETVINLIKQSLKIHKSIKVNFEFFVKYLLPKNSEVSLKSFNTKYEVIVLNSDLRYMYTKFVNKLINKCAEFELSESGWAIDSISHLEVNIVKYNPLRAGSYIPLPKRIYNTKSCVNIKNNDNYCFLWCIMAYLYPTQRNPNRVSSYPHYSSVLNTFGLSFPPSINDIKLFEKNNSDISVNIYGLEKNGSVSGPLYKTLKRKTNHVNLLYITKNDKSHYCLIKQFDRLVHEQLTKHKSKIFLCDECFTYFASEKKLANHNCARIQTVLPEPNSTIRFINFERTRRIPIVIYGDFESLLRQYTDLSKSEHVENIQIHEATCFAYFICCKSNPELNDLVSYRGPNCSQKFIECITNDVHRLYKILSVKREMLPLTVQEEISFQNAKKCHICKNKIYSNDVIVKDHDHFTGKYMGPAHNSCNLKVTACPYIPIVFHNLSGYDCHLFIKELANGPGRINLIPKNKEKYISFTKFVPLDYQNVAQLKFIDSFNFLSSSLDNLVKTLDSADFVNLKSFFKDSSFDLVCKKGVYCYDYIDSWERYNETQLPDQSNFFNILTSEYISNEDYNHALTVWDTFKMSTLGDYTDFYLKCDVLLLCDVFEKFRDMSLRYYDLDPCHYISSPSLSWDAMLLYTKIELDLVSDLETYQMLEKGIRGGLVQCSLRYAKANNKYLSTFNDQEPTSYLSYLDCVNLYGYAMMRKLPKGNFRFLNDNEIANFDVTCVSSDSKEGFILEVDLHYPPEIHDAHSDLPFAAENFIPIGSKNTKLIANLYDKCQYIIHYIHLKKCLENGLKLLKIHRILRFDQEEFLKPYITLNTMLRQQAQSEFEKDFFKKQNNSIFGKTIENKRKQVDIKLVNIWKDKFNKTNRLCGAEKYVSSPNFKNLSIISEKLVAIQLQKSKLVLDRPIYIGFTILELAKSHLYNFHYNVMKRIYKNNIQLCYTDTDSLLYLIYTDDFYQDLKTHINYFDTSNFEENNIYDIPNANMKKPGYFKDEMGGEVISEFVGLRAKLYCISSQKSSIKKAKGIKKCVTNNLTLEKYKRALRRDKGLRDDMYVIRSKNHKVFTQKINKLVLSTNDDKRQIISKNYTTLPWGHYNTIF